MSTEALIAIVERVITDPGFRDQLVSDPGRTLAGHGLTDRERRALLTGDPVELEQLGIDPRLTARLGPPR